MKSILLIIPYFGKWPLWFDAFMRSAELNETINWLIPTDCPLPNNYPKNIKFISYTFIEINELFHRKLGFKVELNYRKFCDLKPTYGHVFEDDIANYDFWGFCDLDIIWGDIRKYVTQDILENFDIISSRLNAISGHFNLFKNSLKYKYFYKEVKNYSIYLKTSKLTRFDENLLTNLIKENNEYSSVVFWQSILCNQENGVDSHQEYYLNKWLWDKGSVFRLKKNKVEHEVMYLHFINWKRTIKFSEVKYNDFPEEFYISYTGIHYRQHTRITIFLNYVKNIFNGYWVNDKRRIRKLKLKSLKKRVNNKLYKIFDLLNRADKKKHF